MGGEVEKDCIKWLEELIGLPMQVAEMDLDELGKFPKYIRDRWLDDLKKRQQEYYLEYMPKCGQDKYLLGYIHLAMLKLVICSREKGEQISLDFIDESMEKAMKLIQKLENDLPVAGQEKGDPLNEILELVDIPDYLAKTISRLYEKKIERKKMELMKEFMLDTILEDARKKREDS